MAQSFTSVIKELTQVKAGEDIFEVITAKRINAIQDAIKSMLRGDNVNSGPGIRKTIGDGWFTLAADAGSGPGGAGHPFRIYPYTLNGPYAVSIQLGTVLGVVPKIAGVSIDKDPDYQPSVYFGEHGLVLLRVTIEGITGTFRPIVKEVGVQSSAGTVILNDKGDPLDEMKMVWDNPEEKYLGYFYIKVGQVFITDTGIGKINQLLMNNIYSFFISVDDVTIVSN